MRGAQQIEEHLRRGNGTGWSWISEKALIDASCRLTS